MGKLNFSEDFKRDAVPRFAGYHIEATPQPIFAFFDLGLKQLLAAFLNPLHHLTGARNTLFLRAGHFDNAFACTALLPLPRPPKTA